MWKTALPPSSSPETTPFGAKALPAGCRIALDLFAIISHLDN
jgi:hypothetical protein